MPQCTVPPREIGWRSGDTGLVVEVEKDFTSYGDECKFGGGKVLRDGQGQTRRRGRRGRARLRHHQRARRRLRGHLQGRHRDQGRTHRRHRQGRQPDVMAGVDPGHDRRRDDRSDRRRRADRHRGRHRHATSTSSARSRPHEAIAAGVTTFVGGGTGPATGTNATTCTPGARHIALMLQATDALPINIGLTGKGNTSRPEGLVDQIRAGAIGLKLHEDWGTTPSRDRLLPRCRRRRRRSGHDPHRHAERVGLRRRLDRGHQGADHPHLSLRGRGRRPRAGHPPRVRRAERPPELNQSDPTLHGQHARRASRHAHGLPPSRQDDPRGRGFRREPHPR